MESSIDLGPGLMHPFPIKMDIRSMSALLIDHSPWSIDQGSRIEW